MKRWKFQVHKTKLGEREESSLAATAAEKEQLLTLYPQRLNNQIMEYALALFHQTPHCSLPSGVHWDRAGKSKDKGFREGLFQKAWKAFPLISRANFY